MILGRILVKADIFSSPLLGPTLRPTHRLIQFVFGEGLSLWAQHEAKQMSRLRMCKDLQQSSLYAFVAGSLGSGRDLSLSFNLHININQTSKYVDLSFICDKKRHETELPWEATIPPGFDDPSYQRLAPSNSKQHWRTVTCWTGALPVVCFTWQLRSATKFLAILWPLESAILHIATWAQIKIWQQCYIISPSLELSMSHAMRPGIISSYIIFAQLLRKLPVFYKTPKFIAIFTRDT
jgi:hypothetical protein